MDNKCLNYTLAKNPFLPFLSLSLHTAAVSQIFLTLVAKRKCLTGKRESSPPAFTYTVNLTRATRQQTQTQQTQRTKGYHTDTETRMHAHLHRKTESETQTEKDQRKSRRTCLSLQRSQAHCPSGALNSNRKCPAGHLGSSGFRSALTMLSS